MSKRAIFLTALLAAATTLAAHAADKRYPLASVQKIEIVEPSNASSWEDKNVLDCRDVVLTEDDVRHALRYMRKISEKAYFREDTERTGCSGGASVAFKNGKTLVIGIEPTGRINTFESNAKLDPVAGTNSYYACEPCKTRKMGQLKEALDRASERRLKALEAEGKIPAGEAQRRLEKLRATP